MLRERFSACAPAVRALAVTAAVSAVVLAAPGLANAAIGVLGSTAAGPATETAGAGQLMGNVHVLGQKAITGGFFVHARGGNADQTFRPVVYATDGAGNPTSLLAIGSETVIPAWKKKAWFGAWLPQTLLESGSYFVGILAGESGGSARFAAVQDVLSAYLVYETVADEDEGDGDEGDGDEGDGDDCDGGGFEETGNGETVSNDDGEGNEDCDDDCEGAPAIAEGSDEPAKGEDAVNDADSGDEGDGEGCEDGGSPATPAAVREHIPPHAGYCLNGTFLELIYEQPLFDPAYEGAVPAFYVAGKGITCDPPFGLTYAGIYEGPDAPANLYPYYK